MLPHYIYKVCYSGRKVPLIMMALSDVIDYL